MGPVAQGEFQGRCHLLETFHGPGDIQPAAEQIFQGLPFVRGFRVKGETSQADCQAKLLMQLFGTNRTEVTPGSDIVEEYFQSLHD